MADTTFVDQQTKIVAAWLNDVNKLRYGNSDATRGAALLQYLSSAAGAAVRTALAKMGDVVSVKDFGAVGDGVTNDTAAFAAATTAINALGGAIFLIPPGTYKIVPTVGAAVCAFSSLHGITILCEGATLADSQTYGAADAAKLFSFTACKNIVFAGKLQVTTEAYGPGYANTAQGLTAVYLAQGCVGWDIRLVMTGGSSAVSAIRASGDPLSYVSKNGRLDLVCTNVHYPWLGAFSGSDVTLQLDATGCGRNFFVYGAQNNRLVVRSKNQKVTSLIKAYLGLGCDNITVDWYDRDSDSCTAAAPAISLDWNDGATNAATHRNIDLRMNTIIPVALPWGNTIALNKYSDGASTPDSTGRGHVLDGFKLSGSMDLTGTALSHLVMGAGAFATSGTPDVQRRIEIADLNLTTGTGAFTVPLPALADVAHIRNVVSNGAVYATNTTNSNVLYSGVKATTAVSGASNTDTHVYVDCNFSASVNYATASNKSYIRTTLVANGNTQVYTSLSSIKQNNHVVRAAKILTGDLTGVNNIFFVSPAQASGLFRLHYHLVSDVSDTNPASRGETAGVKSFSATMNSAGTWVAQLASANEVTERTQVTGSAVTVSLVNGSAAGAHIAVACTNYNGASASGRFELELLNLLNNDLANITAV